MTADITTRQSSQIYVNGMPATMHTNSAGVPEHWTIINQPMSSSASGFVYDPMHEHTEWYGFPQYSNLELTFDSYTIKRCFWAFSEFTTELEEMSTDITLVQKGANNTWRVRFKSQQDYQYWQQRQMRGKKHQIEVGCIDKDSDMADVMALHNEIRSWCKANLVGQHELDSRGRSILAHIKDDNDAVLFKLRWMDVDI
jgi:hypothetical protein